MSEYERGPKGDHGQHGDEGAEGRPGARGDVGRTGETGQVGRTGETGHTGQPGRPGDEGKEGRRGRSNWQAYVMMGLAMLAALVVFVLADERRQDAQAKTALSNCQQIEVVKDQIRGTVQDSVRRLPTLAYYKRNPEELVDALDSARASVERFRAIDCYDLPAVAEELKHP